jgi:Zn-dependent peptidase ImmA (M78 family)
MATRSWSEPLVLRLAKRRRDRDPEKAIAAYAKKLLKDAGQDSLPVEVEAIASLKGVRRRVGEHDFAGRIFVEPDGQLVMDLNSAHNENRRRFTCAHELMHTGFPDFEEEERYRLDAMVGANPVNREEEFLCDFGAAELLMPAELVVDDFRLIAGIAAIKALSRAAEVSFEAAGNRLAALAEEPVVFMVFEFGHKPADQRGIQRGEKVKKRVRLRYARCAHLDLYLPRFKSVPTDGVIARAYRSGMLERGSEELPGTEGEGRFKIEAKRFGREDRQRVLAVAQPE